MKTYVLDASALFAFLQKKPGAYRVNELLKEAMHGRAKVLMSAVNYGEVYGRILREHGPEQALTTMQAVSPPSQSRCRTQHRRGHAEPPT